MTKRTIHFEEQTKDQPSVSLKKQKIVHLSNLQKIVADENIAYFLEPGKTNLIKTVFEITFNTPKKVETLLTYTNYKMFWWAIEHQDLELMQYVLSKTTERGKFLAVCHNDYEIIKKFIDLNIEKIKNGAYKSLPSIETLKILLDANPNKSDLIIEAVKKSVNENILDNLEAASVLKKDFKTVTPDFTEMESPGYKANEVLYSISSADNSNMEQELAGELSHIVESF